MDRSLECNAWHCKEYYLLITHMELTSVYKNHSFKEDQHGSTSPDIQKATWMIDPRTCFYDGAVLSSRSLNRSWSLDDLCVEANGGQVSDHRCLSFRYQTVCVPERLVWYQQTASFPLETKTCSPWTCFSAPGSDFWIWSRTDDESSKPSRIVCQCWVLNVARRVNRRYHLIPKLSLSFLQSAAWILISKMFSTNL